MNKYFFFSLLFMMFGCTRGNYIEYYFSCPSGKYDVSVVLGPSPSEANIRLLTRGPEASTKAQIDVFSGDLGEGRPWVSWSRSGDQLSVLFCNAEAIPQIHRFSFSAASERNLEIEQLGMKEADLELIKSLQQLRRGGPAEIQNMVGEDIIDWYCSGAAEDRTKQYFDKAARKFTIPLNGAL